MPRRPRFTLTDLPLHVVQRGNDRRRCFFNERDFCFYLSALTDAALRYRVLVHAYVLMTNHVHLLMTPLAVGGVSRVMQSLGSRYVKHVNANRAGAGTLWESRYKACLVARDEHVLAVCRYIDLNPVRAGMAAHPQDYRWSSYAALTGLRPDPVVIRHAALEQLGASAGSAYAKWCAEAIREDELSRLREATRRELAFGSDGFRAEVESMTARPTTARAPGPRPGSRKP